MLKLILLNSLYLICAEEFVSYYKPDEPPPFKEKIKGNPLHFVSKINYLSLDKRVNGESISSKNGLTPLTGSLAGIALVAMMALIASLFIYQRKRAYNKPKLNSEYIPKSKDHIGNGKDSFMANGSGGLLYDESSLDKRLAQTAHLYQYQHQKQQMLSLQKQMSVLKDNEEADSEDEVDEDGDYTVYECPGLASASEMEVKNPLFNDSAANASSPPSSSRE
ncbi:unnamed protein product [Gordionus sp. m RMFG-2023]|uniref:protein cab-1-like n=1 Tax=Gordionus sp. m RMFG-2023 TaxID=3053472 RepID=UPI0030DEADCC